jgi:L,D-peptidoglycan transpeptidase YkuD (ErfK/YbiS/YcfS/YnhG family)
MRRTLLTGTVLALATLGASACAQAPAPGAQDARAGAIAGANAGVAARWSQSRQMVVVTTAGWDATQGELRRFEREDGGAWRATGVAMPVVIGRTGAAWGTGLHDVPAGDGGPVKHEGDGRSPAGVFAIGEAFGYASTADTGLTYEALDANDWCVDVDGSPYYNQIVDSTDVGAGAVKDSTEPMRRDLHAGGDQRYRLGFVIANNPRNARGGGSCIFGHLWKSPDSTTAGCTAMAPESMDALLHWLDAGKRPVFVLLPDAEYARLRAAWKLPDLAAHAADAADAAESQA